MLHLKEQRAYSPSSIRTVVAALRVYYGLHLGREGKLFDLVRSPDRQRLPQVLAAHARSLSPAGVHRGRRPLPPSKTIRGEASEMHAWRIQAHVVMRNHSISRWRSRDQIPQPF